MTSPNSSSSRALRRYGSPQRRTWLWIVSQAVLQIVLAIWLRYRARGAAQIPAEGGGLVLGNHQSYLDPILVGLPLSRPISYLARKTLFDVPLLGWILRHTYVMPLSRDTAGAAGIRETLRRLDDGFLVGIFPEGTRSPDGTLGTLKPGFAALIRRTSVPIYPVGIAGAHRALGRGSWFVKPHRVRVVFGEPLTKETIVELCQRGREADLVEAVRQRIAACHHEAEEWLKQ